MKPITKIKGTVIPKWVKPNVTNLNPPVKTITKSGGCSSCNKNRGK